MKRLFLALALIGATIVARAQFVYELKDGSTLEANDAVFKHNETTTVGDTPIDQIARFYRSVKKEEPITEWGEKISSRAYILDMNARNNEKEDDDSNSRNLYSAQYMLEVAGIPFTTTTSLDEALTNSRFILLSSRIVANNAVSFTEQEYQSLYDWVEAGGILIAPAVETNMSANCFKLFGLKHRTGGKDHSFIYWDEKSGPELAYFDEPEELTISIGNNYINTTAYELQEAKAIAHYDDGKVAATCHKLGKGAAYTVGVRWRDVIQRAHLNKDAANRGSTDTFEPSADMYSLFVRGVYAASTPVAVWKNTIPGAYESVLIPTHDCDSRTAYDEMHWMADYEESIGLRSHFFLTVHYFRNPGYLSAFYCDETIPAVKALLEKGHTVGSHSIGHFPDFSISERFPMTETTREKYAATVTRDIENGITYGGSTWAEIVLSKMILDEDLGANVKSFRSGHLCVNNHFPTAMTKGGYSFASYYAASDVLNSFPYFIRMNHAWTGELTSMLQIPLHFSDVFKNTGGMNETNWEEKPDIWLKIANKLIANYAPMVLLIHPNHDWKMFVQRKFINMLDLDRIGLYNFEDYGEFWLNRAAFEYEVWYDSDKGQLLIQASADDITRCKDVSIVVETENEIKSIVLVDENGQKHATKQRNLSPTRYAVSII